MIKKKYLLLIFVVVMMISAFKNVRIEKLNQEALALSLEDVPLWLKKHNLTVPEDLVSRFSIKSVVLDVIKNAENGIDSTLAIAYKNNTHFIRSIQKAAGYSFE